MDDELPGTSIGVMTYLSFFRLYPPGPGASIMTLIKRTRYGGRKARSARRRLRAAPMVDIFGASRKENNGSYVITGFTDCSSIRITNSSIKNPEER